jgi:anti-anti-sigma factor
MEIKDITAQSPLLGSEGKRNIIHLTISGRIDGVTAPEVQKKLEEAIKSKKNFTLILDLQNLEYISSVGIRVLFLSAKKVKEQGGSVKMMNISHGVKGILDLAGFLPGIASQGQAIFESIDEADKYLESLVSEENCQPDAPRKTMILK